MVLNSRNAFTSGSNLMGQPAAITIDLQSFNNMTPEDASAYAAHLGDHLTQLRENDISVIWVGITDEDRLIVPEDANVTGQSQTFEELAAKGFCVHSLDEDTAEIYTTFIERHGPRTDEVISLKSHASALLEDGDDLTVDPAHDSQGQLSIAGQDVTLMQYLRDEGISRPMVFGGASSFCVAQTAKTGVMKNLDVTLDPNLMLSWDKFDRSEQNQPDSLFVWREGHDPQSAEEFHKRHIAQAFDEIEAHPADNFTTTDRDKITFSNTSGYIQSFTAQDPDVVAATTPTSVLKNV